MTNTFTASSRLPNESALVVLLRFILSLNVAYAEHYSSLLFVVLLVHQATNTFSPVIAGGAYRSRSSLTNAAAFGIVSVGCYPYGNSRNGFLSNISI
jgi:hypothetical protein